MENRRRVGKAGSLHDHTVDGESLALLVNPRKRGHQIAAYGTADAAVGQQD